MPKILPSTLRGTILGLILMLTTVGFALFVFLIALIRLLPLKVLREKITDILHKMPEYWSVLFKRLFDYFHKTQWKIYGLDRLRRNGHYLMIANHRSWSDILVLQYVFSKKVPSLRYFMKKELLWQLPIISYACKFLGYPFMQRYSSEFLRKHPEFKGKDIEATRKACNQFKNKPMTLINFVEGGRFTDEKHKKQNSPYKYLLKPKAGGIAFVLTAMGHQLDSIIDTTIIYPDMKISFWKFLCGNISQVAIFIRTLPIKQELFGDYQNDLDFRSFFQFWLNEEWAEKDKLITNKLHSNLT